MTPASFGYLRPETLDEALSALAEHGNDAAVLAGGQSLVPMLRFRIARPAVVVDISRLPGLDTLKQAAGRVCLGALLRHRTLETDTAIAAEVPLLSEAARWVATPAIRNAGTLGGALSLGDPAAEYPAVAMALGGEVLLRSIRGDRRVAADAFFLGGMETAARPDELLLALDVPAARPGDGFGFHEIAERRGDYAMAGAAVERRAEGGVRVAIFGAAEATILAENAAQSLSAAAPRNWTEDLLKQVAAEMQVELGDRALDPVRARLAGVAVARAARQLSERQAA